MVSAEKKALAKERKKAKRKNRIQIFRSQQRKDKAEGFELSKKKIILGHIKNERVQFVVYLVFVLLATLLAVCVHDTYLFYFNNALNNLFFERKTNTRFGEEMEFRDVTTQGDFWLYMTDTFLAGLHGGDYNDTNSTFHHPYLEMNNRMVILRDNILLAPPRLRQIRVKEASCLIADGFRRYFNECYAPYSVKSELAEGSFQGANYYTATDLDTYPVRGKILFYGGGGFVEHLSMEADANYGKINELKENYWIDRATRSVIIEFVLFNLNLLMLNNVKMIAEFPPVGGVVTSYHLEPIRTDTTTGGMYFLLLLFYIVGTYYFLVECIDMYMRSTQLYSITLWNIVDTFNYALMIIALIFFVISTAETYRVMDAIIDDTAHYQSIDRICYFRIRFVDLIACSIFLIWLKVFKFIGFQKTFLQFSETLKRCALDLVGFLVMFMIVFLAYAQLGCLLFGTTHPDFRDMVTSIITLMRMFLGDFEYQLLEDANYILGPIYFVSYILLVFFILLNMFLAIINDTYSVVKSEITRGQGQLAKDFEYLLNIFKNILKRKRTKPYDALDTSWLEGKNYDDDDGISGKKDKSYDDTMCTTDKNLQNIKKGQDWINYQKEDFPRIDRETIAVADRKNRGKSGTKDNRKKYSDYGRDTNDTNETNDNDDDTDECEDSAKSGKKRRISWKLSGFLKQYFEVLSWDDDEETPPSKPHKEKKKKKALKKDKKSKKVSERQTFSESKRVGFTERTEDEEKSSDHDDKYNPKQVTWEQNSNTWKDPETEDVEPESANKKEYLTNESNEDMTVSDKEKAPEQDQSNQTMERADDQEIQDEETQSKPDKTDVNEAIIAAHVCCSCCEVAEEKDVPENFSPNIEHYFNLQDQKIKLLSERVNILEELLEELVTSMDGILAKVDPKKARKK